MRSTLWPCGSCIQKYQDIRTEWDVVKAWFLQCFVKITYKKHFWSLYHQMVIIGLHSVPLFIRSHCAQALLFCTGCPTVENHFCERKIWMWWARWAHSMKFVRKFENQHVLVEIIRLLELHSPSFSARIPFFPARRQFSQTQKLHMWQFKTIN